MTEVKQETKPKAPRGVWVELKTSIGGSKTPFSLYRDGEWIDSFFAQSGDIVSLPSKSADRHIELGFAVKTSKPKG